MQALREEVHDFGAPVVVATVLYSGLPFRHGTGYGMVYLVWVLGMIPLYYACRRYTAFKLAKPAESYWRML